MVALSIISDRDRRSHEDLAAMQEAFREKKTRLRYEVQHITLRTEVRVSIQFNLGNTCLEHASWTSVEVRMFIFRRVCRLSFRHNKKSECNETREEATSINMIEGTKKQQTYKLIIGSIDVNAACYVLVLPMAVKTASLIFEGDVNTAKYLVNAAKGRLVLPVHVSANITKG
ncbi:hypothetical protein Tco_1523589 [Tanacetum coccineum]